MAALAFWRGRMCVERGWDRQVVGLQLRYGRDPARRRLLVEIGPRNCRRRGVFIIAPRGGGREEMQD